ncbi:MULTISPECIES: hypothetical protein [Pseudomonas]|uniref:Uncharacterized protein n=1 Tax=Pseudomonas lutea TaxID=243924 RepID=A0A9X8MH47_9PSED|nr:MULTISPECIES: hypothetical protein [Pseudomonas]SER36785.1 hypothetical protein SAMN05216409_11867 [Pseudomonas lutea]
MSELLKLYRARRYYRALNDRPAMAYYTILIHAAEADLGASA